jgi:two-component system chemotaxis response regulator CheB
LLESAARVMDGRLFAVVLSGAGADATDGVQTVKTHGGIVIAQDEASSEYWSMAQAAIRSGAVDRVLPLEQIAPTLVRLVGGRPTKPSIT